MPVVVALEEIMALIGEGAAATAESAAAIDEMIAASETASGTLAKTGTEAAAKTTKSTSQWQQVMKAAKSDEAKSAWEFVKSSMAAAALEEMTLKKIEAYTSHTAASREMIAELQELKGSTMLGDGVFENATTMLKNGVGEGEVVKSLREIGDIAHGDQKNMQQLALTFAHVREKGVLMRKEFDEFKEAGFDPIKEMAEHWDKFGFKVKVTEGKLKELMEQGKITAGQLTKVMEVATSAGGTHFGGLKDMEGTTLGKDKVLDGEVNTFKTTVGGWFTPIKNAFTDFSIWVMQGVNRVTAMTVPERLGKEKDGLMDNVNAALQLTRGGDARTNILKTLQYQSQYFKNINPETASDDQLKAIQAKVRQDYDRQILAVSHKTAADKLNEEYTKAKDLGERLRVGAKNMKDGKPVTVLSNGELLQYTRQNEHSHLLMSTMLESKADGFDWDARELQPKVTAANNAVAYDNKIQENKMVMDRVTMLMGDEGARKELWGKDTKANYAAMQKEIAQYSKSYTASGGMLRGDLLNFNYGGMLKLLDWQKKTAAATGGAGAQTAAAITGGGRKVININLNQPMVAKQEFHVGNMKEALEISISEFRENYLRVLQGAVASL